MAYTAITKNTGDQITAAEINSMSAAIAAVDTSVLAPKASPSFTGTVTFTGATIVGLGKASVGLSNVDNTADSAKVFAASQITTGVLAPARLGSGVGGAGDRFLADDGSFKTITSGGTSGGSQVITSGPYANDPKRAPDGTLVAIDSTTPILTHIGTRWSGTVADTAVSAQAQPRGTTTWTKYGTATATTVYDDTGQFSESVKITPTATATDTVYLNAPLPSNVREVQMAATFRFSAAPTADTAVFSLSRTGGTYAAVAINKGAAAGKMRFIASYAGWAYQGPDVDPAGTYRLVLAAKSVDGANVSSLRIAFFQVNPADGTETQVGTTYENTAVATDMTSQFFTSVNIGKLAAQASYDGIPMWCDSVRVAHGAGAYGIGLLKAEVQYPEPV